MTKHVYLASKNDAIAWPNHRKYPFCHVHFPAIGNTQLVHIYHYENGTWKYLSFYLVDMNRNN